MTLDLAVALSLLDDLPRVGLTERLTHGDPELAARGAPLVEAARVLRRKAEDAGIGVLPWNAPEFPPLLLAIGDCPPALWYRGDVATLTAPAVAIVGSRAASAVALETAARLAEDLATRGFIVVSGLARGVDSAAHRGALDAARTVAVLGSGLDRVYPPEHIGLADRIAGSGLLLSEYPPGSPPLPRHFPLRNRIISGLSLATVVIEASEHSGSLITAACALEQGREVMAVPGNVLSGRNRGGHALLRDGARIVESAEDVMAELGVAWDARGPAPGRSSRVTAPDDPLLRAMAEGQACDLDELAARTGLGMGRLLPRLLELELRGMVRRAGGGRFLRLSRTC